MYTSGEMFHFNSEWCVNCVDKMKWIENPRTMFHWIIVKLFALFKLPSPTSGFTNLKYDFWNELISHALYIKAIEIL